MADCTVKYSWWQTPIWYYLSPPTMYHGADVALAFSPKGAQDYKRSDQMAVDIKLNGHRFLKEEYTPEDRLNKDMNYLRGQVLSKLTTNEAELDVWMRGAGNAMQNVESSTTCNWDGSECYSARIFPHIDNISETSGSMEGGQEIIIEGNGFSQAKNVEVTIDEVTCKVIDVDATSIKCETGAKTMLDPAQMYYPGEHGIYRTWANAGLNVNNYMSHETNRTLLTHTEFAPEYPKG